MPNNLTMTGASYITSGQKFGTGALSGGYGVLPAATTLGIQPVTGAYTLEAWVRVSTVTRVGVAVQISPFVYIGVDGSGNAIFSANTDDNTPSSVKINDGVWHHVALSVNTSGTALCFVDRVQVLSLTRGSRSAETSIAVATYAFGGAKGADLDWQGQIDEAAYWIGQKYTGNGTPATAAYVGDEANLVGLYHLDGSGGDSQGATPTPTPTPTPVTVDRLNASIFYSPLTWRDNGTSTNTNSAGSYFKTRFTGTSFALNVVPLAGLTSYPVLRAYIDNLPPIDVPLSSGSSVVTFATALPSGTHTVRVVVLRMTEEASIWGLTNAVKITGLSLDNGATVSTPALRSKRAAWFGDSITVGVAVDGAGYAGANSQNTIVPPIMKALDCEYGTIAYGGQGFANAATENSVPAMNTAYAFYSSGASRLTAGQFAQPVDYVISMHGTNPIVSGGSYTQSDVATAISNLRAAAPSATLIFIVPPGGFGRTQITAAVNAAIVAGDTKLKLIDAGAAYEDGLTSFSLGQTARSSDGCHPYASANAEHGAKVSTLVQQAIERRRFTVIPV